MRIKGWSFWGLLLLLFASVIAAGGCGGSDSANAPGDLENFKVEQTITSSDWDARIQEMYAQLAASNSGANAEGWSEVFKRLGAMESVAHLTDYCDGGLSSIKLEYWTKNAKGDLVQATAALFIPNSSRTAYKAPIIAIQHPTEVMRKNSPSKMVNYPWYNITDSAQAQMHLAATIARCGYIVVLPDYLGMGDNTDVHPYCHELLADSVSDAITAAIALVKDFKGTNSALPAGWDEKKIMLMGYSEGAYASMIAAKKMQAEKKLPVTAVAALDGPYSLSGTMRGVMLTAGKEFTSPYFLPYFMNAYDAVYGASIPEVKFDFTVRNDSPKYADYPAELRKMMDGSHTDAEINSLMKDAFADYHGPSTIFSQKFLALLKDESGVVTQTMKKNNSFYNWAPLMPVKMYHHVSDDLVPRKNMDEAQAAFLAAGAAQKDIITEPFDGYVEIGSSIHEKAFLIAFLRAVYWLDNYGYGGRFKE